MADPMADAFAHDNEVVANHKRQRENLVGHVHLMVAAVLAKDNPQLRAQMMAQACPIGDPEGNEGFVLAYGPCVGHTHN